MFETVERKLTVREWVGIVLGLHAAIPGWELALRLISIVLSAIMIYVCVRTLTLDSSDSSRWLFLALAVSIGIPVGLQVRRSVRRASRKRH